MHTHVSVCVGRAGGGGESVLWRNSAPVKHSGAFKCRPWNQKSQLPYMQDYAASLGKLHQGFAEQACKCILAGKLISP